MLSLPDHLRPQILQECPGLFLASLLLVAEARLHTDPPEARMLFQQAEQLRKGLQPPGWGLEAASAWFSKTAEALPSPPPPAGADCAAARADVVVAHCREDLQWLAQLEGMRIWIYEKCGGTSAPPVPCLQVRHLPNLAMESLAYATHIEQQYADLAQYTVFVQGNPEEHANSLFGEVLRSLRAGTYDVPFLHLNARRFLSGSSYCLEDLYRRLFQVDEAPEAFGAYCCSQFVVHRDRVKARPQALYARVRQILLGDVLIGCGQDDGYDARPRIAVSALFEHMWHSVFGEPSVLPLRTGDERLPLFARVDEVPGSLPDQFGGSE